MYNLSRSLDNAVCPSCGRAYLFRLQVQVVVRALGGDPHSVQAEQLHRGRIWQGALERVKVVVFGTPLLGSAAATRAHTSVWVDQHPTMLKDSQRYGSTEIQHDAEVHALKSASKFRSSCKAKLLERPS